MKSIFTYRADLENFGREYKFFISDWDMEKAVSQFTPEERELFEALSAPSPIVAKQILALAMIAYKLYPDMGDNILATTVK